MPKIRIIAGELRGRFISAPNSPGTRPTTNRIREAVMSSVFSLCGSLEGAYVLDAFAGSGAMGFEAISRGAKLAVFCDDSSQVCTTIEDNAKSLKLSKDSYQVFKRNVMDVGFPLVRQPYDLVFLDPPYAFEFKVVVNLLYKAKDAGLFEKTCIFVYEHEQAVDFDAGLDDFIGDASLAKLYKLEAVAEKKYGKTKVSYLRFI